MAVVCLLSVSALAADSVRPESPAFDGSLYVTVDGSALGAVTVFLPVNYWDGYLTLRNGIPFNVSNSTVTGYVLDGSGNQTYTVRWPAWSYAEYRDYDGTGYTYSDFGITGVSSSNVQWITYDDLEAPKDDLYQLILIGLIGLGVVVCFMKRW